MASQPANHMTDELLELYSLDRLSGADLERIEEHLLVCPECQERLKDTDAFVKAMRGALEETTE